MAMLLGFLLRHLVTKGTLRVIDSRGTVHDFPGDIEGPRITVKLHEAELERRLFFNPRLYLGEAYMDGSFTVEDADIYDFLLFIGENQALAPHSIVMPLHQGFGRALRLFQQYNPLGRAQKNAAHHYNLSDTLYDLFLDNDRQYSCAYWPTNDISLEEAQANKKRHLAAKLLLRPGQKVLDIGSGWGGLAIYLAQETGVAVTGLTLSSEQLKVAERRAIAAGVADRVKFRLRDYREEHEVYDRIVSVGMFEHVGVPHYKAFFRKLKELLTEDGVALLHSIGRMDGPATTNPWLRKYIFPGGYAPSLSEVVPVAEKVGLWITDIEILRLHYAETLREWRARFTANRDQVKTLYDERFCRMWEFYLAGSEVAFRWGGHLNFQMQLAKHVDAVPLTRDYITDWARSHIPPLLERVERAA
jgi:cyclopropane-fatty-acyl-phospholipid synthase